MSATTATERWPSVRLGVAAFGVICLVAVSIPYVMLGTAAWREDDVLRKLVVRFFQDVAAGRRDAALNALSDDYRASLSGGALADAWSTDESMDIRVLSVAQQTDRAELQVSVGKSGFSIKPRVTLRRSRRGEWKITAIDDIAVDPRWVRQQERDSGEHLADEFAEKLHIAAPGDAANP